MKALRMNPTNQLQVRRKTLRPISDFKEGLREYLTLMQKLLGKLQVSKVRKITKEIKKQNVPFRQYLNENRIATVRYEDVVKFEEYA